MPKRIEIDTLIPPPTSGKCPGLKLDRRGNKKAGSKLAARLKPEQSYSKTVLSFSLWEVTSSSPHLHGGLSGNVQGLR